MAAIGVEGKGLGLLAEHRERAELPRDDAERVSADHAESDANDDLLYVTHGALLRWLMCAIAGNVIDSCGCPL